jgi:hypothetical protein
LRKLMDQESARKPELPSDPNAVADSPPDGRARKHVSSRWWKMGRTSRMDFLLPEGSLHSPQRFVTSTTSSADNWVLVLRTNFLF